MCVYVVPANLLYGSCKFAIWFLQICHPSYNWKRFPGGLESKFENLKSCGIDPELYLCLDI